MLVGGDASDDAAFILPPGCPAGCSGTARLGLAPFAQRSPDRGAGRRAENALTAAGHALEPVHAEGANKVPGPRIPGGTPCSRLPGGDERLHAFNRPGRMSVAALIVDSSDMAQQGAGSRARWA